ncbi:unnamed protein product [Fusarium langsethiae]|nr:unnamed protein product [Fusarium langsethiae]
MHSDIATRQVVSMASTTFSLDFAKRSLDEDGVFDLETPVIGEAIRNMQQKNFPFFTEYGLHFCKEYVLNNACITSIIESFFQGQRCILAHWLRYEAYPGHIVCFRRGGPKAGQKVLMVHLWAKGSRVDYYRGSHLHELPTEMGRRSLHEIPPAALAEVGCNATEKNFKDGGIVVLDSRVGYEMKEGYPIIFEFGTEDVVKNWAKMILPKLSGLPQKVAEMESPKIGLNFEFEDLPQPQNT